MKKFKKLVFYDIETPEETPFINELKKYAESFERITAKVEFEKKLKREHVEGADALVTRILDKIPTDFFENTSLKYIGAMHTARDEFDDEIMKKHGITFTNVANYSTEAVATSTISALMNITLNTYNNLKFVKDGDWGWNKVPLGWELKGKKIGIIGLGDIGTRVGEIAQSLGMDVLYYSRTRKEHLEKQHGWKYLELNDLLATSNVVCLTAARNDQTENLLSKERLNLMQKGAVLVSPVPHKLIDLNAVYQLCSKNIISAWFDAVEPPVKDLRDKLRKLPNVYLTPHSGWWTEEAQKTLKEITINNIKEYLKNQTPS